MQSKGVCHRDLSLENILVDDQHCLIIDMGMCLREPYSGRNDPAIVTDVENGTMRRLMTPQGVCGKHNYMSPEVFQNVENFDGFAIDLWAAGVILYVMLTGFPPYDQADMVDERFSLIVTGQLTQQLDAWNVRISRDAGDLLQKMLVLDPRHRLTLAQVMCHPWVRNPEVTPPAPLQPEGWRKA
jgi:serine/threonine protein kinase